MSEFRHSYGGSCLRSLFILLSSGVICTGLHAQEASVSTTASIRYDDNVLRLPDEFPDVAIVGSRSDTIIFAGADARYETNLGATDLVANAAAGYTKFSKNSRLDAFNYRLALNAERNSRLSTIVASISQQRRLIEFEDVTTRVGASQSLTDADLDASYQVAGDIRLVGSAAYRRNSTNLPQSVRDNERTTLGGGVGYYSPTGSYARFEYRQSHSRGLQDFPVTEDGSILMYQSRVDERAAVVRVKYLYSELTQVDATVGYVKHNDKSILDADFEGLLADIRATWSPRDRLIIQPMFSRSFATENSLYNNGVRVTRYGIDVQGAIGPALTWRGFVNQEKRDFRYDLAAPDPGALARNDTITRFGVLFSYPIGDRIAATLQYDHLERSSTQSRFAFRSDAVTVTLQVDLYRR